MRSDDKFQAGFTAPDQLRQVDRQVNQMIFIQCAEAGGQLAAFDPDPVP